MAANDGPAEARADEVAALRASLEQGDRSFYPTVVNRLDVQTSGIVILTLTRGVHTKMQAMASARMLRRAGATRKG